MNLLSISKMAKIHNISRQTLIYYDQMDIFKPAYIDEKGYRFYREAQIPFLREICFLKSIGVSLKDIGDYFKDREPKKVIALLNERKEELTKQISDLNRIRSYVQQRINQHEFVVEEHYKLEVPFIKYFSERSIICESFQEPPNRKELHTTLMKAWQRVNKGNFALINGFGTLIRKNSLESGDILEGAGSFIFTPYFEEIPGSKKVPKGDYACFCRYGMPYETEAVEKLHQWILENDYEITGDILDVCLLDTTFYQSDKNVDFCILEIPIKK